MQIEAFKQLVENSLLPNIDLKTLNPVEPILVRNYSSTWKLLGNGNYAAVFVHSSKPDWVVKVYGRNHDELKKEIDVYKKLGNHPCYSDLYGYGENYLVLKRIEGITLFNALIKGVPIPETVIKDIDSALKDAKSKGLNPYDVHGKNVAMKGNRGYIVDISDFYKSGYCSKWDDLKKGYYRIYKPFILKFHPPFPFLMVDSIRKGYRFYKKLKRKGVC